MPTAISQKTLVSKKDPSYHIFINTSLFIFSMLQFLKKIIKKEEQQATIAFHELENWLSSKEAYHKDLVKKDVADILEALQKESERILAKLKELEEAALRNDKMPQRALAVMQGNREAFIRALSRFFSNIDLKHEDVFESSKKSIKMQKEMTDLASSTARSHAILSQLFANHIADITESMRLVDLHLKKITSTVETSTLQKILHLKQELQDIQKKIQAKARHEQAIKDHSVAAEETSKKKEKVHTDLVDKEQSSEFGRYQELLDEAQQAEVAMLEVENTLFHDFSDLERVLRKFSKITIMHEALIEQYLQNAIHALMADEKLDIIALIEGMKKAVMDNTIELEERKREKILAKVNQLTQDYFMNMKEKYSKLKMSLDSVNTKIEENIVQKEVNSLKDEEERLEMELGKYKAAMQDFERELQKIDVDALKKNIEEKINKELAQNKEKIIIQ